MGATRQTGQKKINEFSIFIISDNIGNKFEYYFKYLEGPGKFLRILFEIET
jgi:hypothetical protein